MSADREPESSRTRVERGARFTPFGTTAHNTASPGGLKSACSRRRRASRVARPGIFPVGWRAMPQRALLAVLIGLLVATALAQDPCQTGSYVFQAHSPRLDGDGSLSFREGTIFPGSTDDPDEYRCVSIRLSSWKLLRCRQCSRMKQSAVPILLRHGRTHRMEGAHELDEARHLVLHLVRSHVLEQRHREHLRSRQRHDRQPRGQTQPHQQ